ncbi:unnamed protein product [Brassica rapa subsp. trilocularis]
MVGLHFRRRTFVFGGRPAFGFDDAPATPVLSSAFGTASHLRSHLRFLSSSAVIFERVLVWFR